MTLRRHIMSQELDRRTWASFTSVVMDYETIGSGSFLTPELKFGVRFSGSPYLSSGAALGEVSSLVDGDYPFVSVGVAEWVTMSFGEDAVAAGAQLEHVGVKLWISVSSRTSYKIRHTLAFEGLAMKTPLVER